MLRTLAFVLILWSGCESGGGGGCASPTGSDVGKKPVIDEMRAIRSSVTVTDTNTITVIARDLAGENLSYVWTTPSGSFQGPLTESAIIWVAPNSAGPKAVKVRVQNQSKEYTERTINIQVSSVTTPIVNITAPADGLPIPASALSVNILANVSNAPIDSAKCYINGAFLAKVGSKTVGQAFQFAWNVSALNGSKAIKVQAWTHSLAGGGATTTDSSIVNVSIEGTIGKP